MAATVEDIRRRLYEDTAYWAEHCAKIVDKERNLVPLLPNAAQRRLDAKLEEQHAAGLPMRVIILKARQLGFSTWVQAKIMHRISQRENRRALVVAHNKDAAANLFRMGERIWTHLPNEAGLKPPRLHYRRGAYMLFANLDRESRESGDVGLDSSLQVDTAKEVEAGRSHTFSELHLSEVAFWPYVEKMDSLLNAVPDVPDSMVIVESTANGTNHFKTAWDRAVRGESEYAHLFFAWFEEPSYRLDEARTEAIFRRVEFGEGPWGEDEPRLRDEFGCDDRQLAWRRYAIVDKCGSKLDKWNQEYPATPEDAFQASGRQVFSRQLVQKVLRRCEETDPELPVEGKPPYMGTFEAGRTIPRQVRSGRVEVPADPKFKQEHHRQRVSEGKWRVWEWPEPGWKPGDRWDRDGEPPTSQIPKGRYVVNVDPAEGTETTSGESAYMAVQVINHRTKRQCAEFRSRTDWDLVLNQAFMAALFFNLAWIGVEKTGGYGLSMIQRLRDYGYPAIYRRSAPDNRQPVDPDELFGFNTTRATKPLLEDGIAYLLREMPEVFLSYFLAYEMTTYIRDPKTGKTGPEPDAFSDLLMAFGIGEQIALEVPIPSDRGPTSTTTRKGRVNPVTGYGA